MVEEQGLLAGFQRAELLPCSFLPFCHHSCASQKVGGGRHVSTGSSPSWLKVAFEGNNVCLSE